MRASPTSALATELLERGVQSGEQERASIGEIRERVGGKRLSSKLARKARSHIFVLLSLLLAGLIECKASSQMLRSRFLQRVR